MTDSRDDGRPVSPDHPRLPDDLRATPDETFRGADADARPLPGIPPAPAAPAALPPKRHRLRRFLGWWMVLGMIATACVVCLAIGFSVFDAMPVHIVIDGDDVTGLSLDGTGFAVKALVFACLAAVALLLLLLVPLVALIVVGSVAFALVAGFGTPLVILAFALAVLTSPVWLVGLLVWFFARRRRAHSATIAA
jgi:hypothetical protein